MASKAIGEKMKKKEPVRSFWSGFMSFMLTMLPRWVTAIALKTL